MSKNISSQGLSSSTVGVVILLTSLLVAKILNALCGYPLFPRAQIGCLNDSRRSPRSHAGFQRSRLTKFMSRGLITQELSYSNEYEIQMQG